MLNHVLAALNDCALAFDQDEARYSFISTGIQGLTGHSSNDFNNNTALWQQLVDPRDKVLVQDSTDKLSVGEIINLSYRIITPDTGNKWVKEKRSLFLDEETGHKILLSVVKDTQREEEEKYNHEESITGYSILFDNNPNPMWIYDAETLRIVKVNNAAITTYGYTGDEFLTMTIKDLRPKDEHSKLENFLKKNRIREGNTGFKMPGIWKHINKKGEIIFAEINGDSIRHKHINCRIVVAVNVTERIRSQEELKLREKFLNSLIDSQTNFLIRIDINGLYTFVNKQFLKTLGYTNNEIIGNHFTMTATAGNEHLCKNAFAETINNPGKVVNLSNKKMDKSGGLHDTEWELTAITDEDGVVTGIQGIGQDVTERNNTQREIIFTKNSLEAIINNTEDLIWSIDMNYRYMYINQAYKNNVYINTGIMPQKGDVLHGVFEQEMLETRKHYYSRSFDGERYSVINERFDPVDGKSLFFEINFNPIFNSAGEVTGVGCFAHDITERIKTNQEIINQNERLQNIASISSHELRKPVATMLGLINIIDREDFYNPENKEIIEHLLVVGSEIDDVIRLIVESSFTSNLPGELGFL